MFSASPPRTRTTPARRNPSSRWHDAGPLGFAGGANKYRFAGNDPVNFGDPTGTSQAGHPLAYTLGNQAGEHFGGQFSGSIAASGLATTRDSAFAGLAGAVGSGAASMLRSASPLASSLFDAGLGAVQSGLFGPINYGPGKVFAHGRVSQSGKTFILNEPIVNAKGRLQTNVPIVNGTVDFSQFAMGEVEIAVTGLKGGFDQRQAATAYSKKYTVVADERFLEGRVFHHGPVTRTIVESGVELPVARMQLVPFELNEKAPHIGSASIGRSALNTQNVTSIDARAAANTHNGRVLSALSSNTVARAFAGLNVYLTARDVLRDAGVIAPTYEVNTQQTYVFHDGGGGFKVRPGGWFRSADRFYVSGPRAGDTESITSADVAKYQAAAELKYGKYIPGGTILPFAPRFIPGTARKSAPIVDSFGRETGYIDASGPHDYHRPIDRGF